MNAVVVDNRKSLMVSDELYTKISKIAKKAGVTRPLVIDGMLSLVDETRLLMKLQEIRAEAAADAAEDRKKRQMLASLASELDTSQIESLLAQLQSQTK